MLLRMMCADYVCVCMYSTKRERYIQLCKRSCSLCRYSSAKTTLRMMCADHVCMYVYVCVLGDKDRFTYVKDHVPCVGTPAPKLLCA